MGAPEWKDRFDELSSNEQTFVERWLIDFNPHQAALDAGYSIHTARSDAWSWVKDPTKKPALYETCMVRRRAKLEAMGEGEHARQLIERLRLIATADPAELVHEVVRACRHCWGFDHKYHWTPAEFEAAVRKAEHSRGKLPIPDCSGGLDFDKTRDPHPECPECRGVGVTEIRPRDTRDLSPAGRALYRGVRTKKDGSFEMLMADQNAAAALYAKITGIAIERREITGKDGAPLIPAPITTADPNAAAQEYADMIRGS